LEVKQKPKFETRIGYREVDVIALRLIAGLSEVFMSVDVKDAPNLVV
jgi:hypothetical protein